MRKMQLAITAAALAMLTACGFGGPDYPSFEGAAYRIEGEAANPDGGVLSTVIYRDGAKMRVETASVENGDSIIVFDRATNAAYLLAEAPPVAPTASGSTAATGVTPTADSASGAESATGVDSEVGEPATSPSATPPSAAPMGVAIRVDDAEAPQPLETAWQALGAEGAEHVGECSAAGENGEEWKAKGVEADVERVACITGDGIVLRIREGNDVLFQATSLERGPQDSELFGVPDNYRVVDPDALVNQVDETMDQLDSTESEGPA